MTPDPEQGPASRRPDHATIRDWLVRQWRPERVCRAHDRPRANFDSYGLGSKDAVALSGDLETWLGCRLSPTLLYQYPTSEALARYLAGTSCSPAVDGCGRCGRARTRRHRRHGLPVPLRTESGCILALLCEGRDAIGEVPPDRWDARPSTMPIRTSRQGRNPVGRIPAGIDRFDPRFFGIAPREARAWTPNSGCCWRWPGRRWRMPGSRPGSWRALGPACSWASRPTTTACFQFGDLEAHRRLHGHGQRLSIAARPSLVPVRTCRGRAWPRHGLLVIAGGRAPGLSEPASGRVQPWRWPAA